jgi:hypothetical protein
MNERGRAVWFTGALMLGVGVLSAGPAQAQDKFTVGFTPVLAGNGPSFCGPCEPTPVVTRAAPQSPVVALRYRWSAETRHFALISKQEVGATDHQGELRFTLEQGKASLDKVAVVVGGRRSDGFLFLTNGGCSGPNLCPLPRRYHIAVNASAFLPGQHVVAAVSGAAPGQVVDVSHEAYVEDGEEPYWVPVSEPLVAEVDALGHAAATLEAVDPGVYRVIARDRETGEESSFALFEVSTPR